MEFLLGTTHVYGSPSLSLNRTSAYQKANFTVVALCKYEFKVRPSFRWKTMDDKLLGRPFHVILPICYPTETRLFPFRLVGFVKLLIQLVT